MDVVDNKTIALPMKLAETVHIVRFDGSREGFCKVRAAGHGDGSIVGFVGPSSRDRQGKCRFSGAAWPIKVEWGAVYKLFDTSWGEAFGYELVFGAGDKDVEKWRGSNEACERPFSHSGLLEGNDGYRVIEPIHRSQFIGAKNQYRSRKAIYVECFILRYLDTGLAPSPFES